MLTQVACPTSANGDDEVRHLTSSFALHCGKQIEQFLNGFDHSDQDVIGWAALRPATYHITLYLSEVADVSTGRRTPHGPTSDEFRAFLQSNPPWRPSSRPTGWNCASRRSATRLTRRSCC